LLKVINEQDVCHEGEPDYAHNYAFSRSHWRCGNETSDVKPMGEGPANRGYGRYIQGHAMEHLSHVIFGMHWIVQEFPSNKDYCNNFFPDNVCPFSPCNSSASTFRRAAGV
jgi:hypothetical protein